MFKKIRTRSLIESDRGNNRKFSEANSLATTTAIKNRKTYYNRETKGTTNVSVGSKKKQRCEKSQ